MVADLSLVEAMASYLHVAFVWNPEEGRPWLSGSSGWNQQVRYQTKITEKWALCQNQTNNQTN